MNTLTLNKNTNQADPNDKPSIPPARKENGDVEGDGKGGQDVIGSPNEPTSDPKKPSSEA